MQMLTSEPRCRRGDGTFIVRAMPENAISRKMKWERWSERKISIFYEYFPLLPLGFLLLSAPNHIPSSVIPFSKNVIRKSPLDFLLPNSLPVWARWCSLTSSRFSVSLLLASVTSLCCPMGVLRKATYGLYCPLVLQIITLRLSLHRFGCIFICHCFLCRKSQSCASHSYSNTLSFLGGDRYSTASLQLGSCFCSFSQ